MHGNIEINEGADKLCDNIAALVKSIRETRHRFFLLLFFEERMNLFDLGEVQDVREERACLASTHQVK